MKILALETSGKDFSLAVILSGRVKVFRHIHLRDVLSESIISSIDTVLKDARVSLKDLDGFVISLGPGSFTSLRVGLATVKGLSLATDKPIVGISSLDALAMNANQNPNQEICVICDAKRNLLYSCVYLKKDGKLLKKADYFLADVKTVLKEVKSKTYFIGDGIKLFKEEILKTSAQKKTASFSFADEKDWYPRADRLGLLALERFKKKKFDNPDKIIPIYLYPDDCQVKR